MFELGYLNEESASYLFRKVGCDAEGYGKGVENNIILDILDAKYKGDMHAFTPTGLSMDELKGYIPNRMSTLGLYQIINEDKTTTTHAVIVFHYAGKIGYMDAQRCESRRALHYFTEEELKSLSIAFAYPEPEVTYDHETDPTSHEAAEPEQIIEVTPEMIDEIIDKHEANQRS